MNMLMSSGCNEMTMSSREIADLVKARHADVCRTIERLIGRNVINGYAPSAYTHPQNGQQYTVFNVNKRDSYVIVAQLSPEFTADLVDRWQELESQSPAIPQTYAAALLEAGRLAMENDKQREQLALAAPKVEFVNRFIESTGNKTFRETAKILQANERELRAYLYQNKIMYQIGGGWMPYQNHIDAGRFEVKAGEANGHVFSSAKFTPKGVEWIAGKWIAQKG